MTATALLLGSTSGNQCDQVSSASAVTHFGELRCLSSTTANAEYYGGMRFTTVPTIANLRRAKLQLAVLNATYDDLHFTIKGHKVANSPVFATASRPKVRWTNEATTASLTFDQDAIPAGKAFEIPDGDDALVAIIAEIIGTPGYAAGNPITLLYHCSTSVNKEARLYTGTNTDLGPRLILTYGTLSSDATTWDHVSVGDSLAATMNHDGFEVASLSVFGLGTTTVGKAAAGMQSVDNPGLYGGDLLRGHETPATLERVLSDEWGATNIDMVRREHAVYGTTLAGWHAAIANTTGGLWGNPAVGSSLRARLANPTSPWQAVWLSAGWNDMHAFGGGHLLINEWSPATADAEWQDYVDDTLEPQLRDVLDHIYDDCAGDPEHLWTIIPGAPNFCVKKSNNTSVQYFPQSGSRLTNTRDTFRTLYTLTSTTAGSNAIGGFQWTWDCSDTGTGKGDGTLAYQSAIVRAAAKWQQTNHPEDIPPGQVFNPSGSWWSAALAGCGWSLPISGNFWNYGSVDRWAEGWRNVTDITVNARMRMLDAVIQRVAADYPRVLFLPALQSMGIDTTYSADPSSELAQSDPLKWVEGIHPNKDGLTDWITQPDADGTPSIVDRMAHRVPFLQRFSTDIWSSWDGDAEVPVTNDGYFDGDDLVPTYIEWGAAA